MENTLFDSYILDVKSQLHCNAYKEEKEQLVTYSYTNSDIDEHLSYFKSRFDAGVSAHTALELFYYELNQCSFPDVTQSFIQACAEVNGICGNCDFFKTKTNG